MRPDFRILRIVVPLFVLADASEETTLGRLVSGEQVRLPGNLNIRRQSLTMDFQGRQVDRRP